MQTVITYLVLFFTGICLQAQSTTIELTVTGFKSNEGAALVGLYNSETSFLNTTFKGTVSQIEANQVKVVFEDIPEGTYAISVIHDENNNKKFDMLMGFIPQEDYGTSNNAKGFFGPPQWEDARFSVTKGATTQIQISIN